MQNKTLFMMRHGQTEWNVTGKLNSTTDIGLSQQGREAVMALQEPFAHLQIDRVFASPLRRAVETANLAVPGCQLETDARLVEVDFGPFEGKAPCDFAGTPLDEAFRQWRLEENPVIPEDAEDFEQAAQRAQAFLDDIQQFEGATLIVSHGVFLRVLLCCNILGMPAAYYRRLRLDNGRIVEVQWENDLIRLTRFNASL